MEAVIQLVLVTRRDGWTHGWVASDPDRTVDGDLAEVPLLLAHGVAAQMNSEAASLRFATVTSYDGSEPVVEPWEYPADATHGYDLGDLREQRLWRAKIYHAVFDAPRAGEAIVPWYVVTWKTAAWPAEGSLGCRISVPSASVDLVGLCSVRELFDDVRHRLKLSPSVDLDQVRLLERGPLQVLDKQDLDQVLAVDIETLLDIAGGAPLANRAQADELLEAMVQKDGCAAA
jgi:hypothetical protein